MVRNRDWERLPSVSRRGFLGGAAGIGALGFGGATFLDQSEKDGGSSTFILRQGKLRYEVSSLGDGETNVKEFYDYDSGLSSGDPSDSLIDQQDASRLFVYEGPVDSSLVFLHGGPDADHGGSAAFSFSGLSRDKGEWAVRDDTMDVDDDFEKWEGGNAKARWEWGAGQTDGGAFWGALDRKQFSISITPKQLRGVSSWRFLSGSAADPERYTLSTAKPAKLRPARKRSVKRLNVEIMPDENPYEFDPDSKEKLLVAVKEPPEDADSEAWASPGDLDPGNYSMNFGSKSYLAGGNAAQPQQYFRKGGTLYLEFKIKAAKFTLDSAYGYLVGKAGEKTFVRGRDTVRPGGFDNTADDGAGLVVSELNVDPESGKLVDEYVELTNDGEEALAMGNWTLSDEEGWEFYFPADFSLESGASVRVHTGDGEWTDTDLYWGVEYQVWDDEDTVKLTDANGNELLDYSYPRS
jgi:hypothetical protein